MACRCSCAWQRLNTALPTTEEAVESPGSSAGKATEYHQRIHAQYAKQTRAQFRQLGNLSRTANVPILVVVSPVFQYEARQPYPLQNLHDNIAQLCAENGLEFLDLLSFLGGENSKELAFDVWHPNVQGHAVIADVLESHLENR